MKRNDNLKHRKAGVRGFKLKLTLKPVQCRGCSNQWMVTFWSSGQICLYTGDRGFRLQNSMTKFYENLLTYSSCSQYRFIYCFLIIFGLQFNIKIWREHPHHQLKYCSLLDSYAYSCKQKNQHLILNIDPF